VNLVERVKAMLLSPKSEWPRIAAEPMTAPQIYTSWVMILGAIAPLAIAIGWGMSVGFSASIRFAIANYVIALVMTALIALVVDFLAPQFGGTKDFVAALKLSAFSYTAAFVAGVFHLLGSFGGMLVLIGMVYAWYTFYLGAPVLKKCSEDKAVLFTIIVVVIGFVLGMLFGVFASSGGFAPRLM
jgi:hypothetical protein